jgi:hypothetical protein
MIEAKHRIAQREWEQRLAEKRQAEEREAAEKRQAEEREAEEKKRAEKEAELARLFRMPTVVYRGLVQRMEGRRAEAVAKLEERWIGRADYDKARKTVESYDRWLGVLRGTVTGTEKDLDVIDGLRKECMPA